MVVSSFGVVESPDTTTLTATIVDKPRIKNSPNCKNIILKANCLVSVSIWGTMGRDLFTNMSNRSRHHEYQGLQ